MINVVHEVVAALIYGGLYLIIFWTGEIVRRQWPARMELSRKSVHLLGGLVSMSFPFYIHSHWTILCLALSFAGIITVTKKMGLLQSVHGVKRDSYGGVLYPLAIYLIFILSYQRPVIYLISILVLTVSDTMAALIGGKYGAIKYDVEGNLKSVEGSIVFFFITFLCIHLPLLLMTNIGRAESVIIAFVIAVLVTGFEAISLSGSDNLFVPFGTYFILTKMTRLPLDIVSGNLYALLILIFLTFFLSLRPRLFRTSGLITMILLNYAAISLCNFYWLLPLLLAQVLYYVLVRIFTYYEGLEKVRSFQVKVILYIGIIPTILIFIANVAPNQKDIFLPFLVSITAQIAIICEFFIPKYASKPFRLEEYLTKHKEVTALVCSGLTTLIIALLPIQLYLKKYVWQSSLLVWGGTWISYFLNFRWDWNRDKIQNDPLDFQDRLLSTAVGVLIVLIMQGVLIK